MRHSTAFPRRRVLAAAGALGTCLTVPAQARASDDNWIPPEEFLDALPSLMRLGCLRSFLFSHEGNNEGRFVSYVAGDAARGRGIVILTNGDSGSGISQRIVRAATGIDPLSFIAALNPPQT